METPTPAATATIVRATSDQVDLVTPIFLAYSEFYGRTVAPAAASAYLRDGLASGTSVIYVALQQAPDGVAATVVGFLQMHPSQSSKLLGLRWIVNDLYVVATQRRQHLGQRLLAAAKEHAIATHAKDLQLRTKVTNDAARAFYASLGWVALDEFITYEYRLPAEGPTHVQE